MAFNPKTYDLSNRIDLAETWASLERLIDKREGETFYLPVGTKAETYNFMHALNRYRSAYRIQKEAGWVWNHIKLAPVELENEKPWGIRITHFKSDAPKGLKVLDAEGNEMFEVGKDTYGVNFAR